MLRSLKNLEHYTVSATDGEVGSVTDFLVDDARWITRYLVVKTGGFLTAAPNVIIAPISFRGVDWRARHVDLALTIEQIRKSPVVDTKRPVSRQHEREYYSHYGYPYYWGNGAIARDRIHRGTMATGRPSDGPPSPSERAAADGHLRSVNEIRGYHVQGVDEAVGTIDDLIVDDVTWELRYLVVDTSHWWLGKKVLVALEWVRQVSWSRGAVEIDLSRRAMKDGPTWDAANTVSREYEIELYDHYGRSPYWKHAHPPQALGSPLEIGNAAKAR